ncbi:MAG: hypothetical protein GY842_08125 [bacterium]|nr:hypothetical protein [bacterium]
MPLMMHTDEIQPGMRLAEPLTSSDGRILLSAGRKLSSADVAILQRTHIRSTLRVTDPILDECIEFEDDSSDRAVASSAHQRVSQTMGEVEERFSQHASLASMDFQSVHEAVTDVLEYLGNNPVSIALLNRTLGAETYLSQHAGNVFYLSMILGTAVRDCVAAGRERRGHGGGGAAEHRLDLLPLGLGAMFCDLGMLPLQHLYTSDEPLSDDDRRRLREHPLAGAEALPADFSSLGRTIVQTHHENHDGSGYPVGLAGPDTHLFARVVRIADAFDAATSRHVYREAKSAARVLWEMSVGPFARFYDPVIIKIFAQLIQPFPIGAKLRLADGRYAVVVRYNRRRPFLPTVIVAYDVKGRKLSTEELAPPVCLDVHRELRIQSFAGEDVSFIYTSRLIEDFTPFRLDINTLFESTFP